MAESVYHQRKGRQPVTVGCRPFSRDTESDEQPYSREVTAGPEWQVVDCGWVVRAGMIVVTNLEPSPRKSPPTGTQLELGVGTEPTPFAVVSPGESIRLTPARPISMRTSGGSVRCLVNALPG